MICPDCLGYLAANEPWRHQHRHLWPPGPDARSVKFFMDPQDEGRISADCTTREAAEAALRLLSL